jgi:hypothetical protein
MIALLCLPSSSVARQFQHWTYNRLFKKADVVVIASPLATGNTDDREADSRWSARLVGQNTTFTVHRTLKGTVKAQPLTVLHFRLKDGTLPQDGPRLIAFRTKGPTIEGGQSIKFKADLGRPDYLLFLKAREDERYAPVSGHMDAKSAVKEIYSPLPAVIDGHGEQIDN